MPPVAFEPVFAALRSILEPYAAKSGFVISEAPGKYQLSSSTKTDRAGKPLFIAAVQVNKSYVSYHLMPIYMNPALHAAVSPALKRRMQGKACFNFTAVDRDQVKELAALTQRGVVFFRDVKLPWEKPTVRQKRRGD